MTRERVYRLAMTPNAAENVAEALTDKASEIAATARRFYAPRSPTRRQLMAKARDCKRVARELRRRNAKLRRVK